jgi:hypothetical protein
MKRAIENRFFSWLLRFNPDGPQWRYYGLAVFSFVFSAMFIAMGLLGVFYRLEGLGTFGYLGALACWCGVAFVAIGKLVRDVQKNQDDTTKRLTEQDERIRKLEAQIAALTPPSPTP